MCIYIYICMYIVFILYYIQCIYIYIYVCVYISHKHTHTHARAQITSVHVHTHTHIYIYTYIFRFIYSFIYSLIYLPSVSCMHRHCTQQSQHIWSERLISPLCNPPRLTCLMATMCAACWSKALQTWRTCARHGDTARKQGISQEYHRDIMDLTWNMEIYIGNHRDRPRLWGLYFGQHCTAGLCKGGSYYGTSTYEVLHHL